MSTTLRVAACVLAVCLLSPSYLSAQINFPKTGYSLSIGDSVPAGEGALPVTHGFAVPALRSRRVRREPGAGLRQHRHQRCDVRRSSPTSGAAGVVHSAAADRACAFSGDACGRRERFLRVSRNKRCAGGPRYGDSCCGQCNRRKSRDHHPRPYLRRAGVATPLRRQRHPGGACARRELLPLRPSGSGGRLHPQSRTGDVSRQLAARVASIQSDIALAGKTARVGYVDTFGAMEGKQGLLLINRRHGFTGPFEFEIHPSNAGHTAIAREFEQVWNTMR